MEIVLVVLKFVESLTQNFRFRLTIRICATDLLNGNIPLEGHGKTAGTIMRIPIFC
jgi:hypothetical protein